MKNPKYQIYRDRFQLDRFQLISEEGEVLLTSEPYSAKHIAEIGVISCQDFCSDPRNYIKRDTLEDEYYFVLKSSKNEVLGVSPAYKSPIERDEMIRVCQRDGITENVENLIEIDR